MGHLNYILDKHGSPVPEPDLIKWGHWFETSARVRRVGATRVGEVAVSTIFLALDHGWGVGHVPILWETLCFDAWGKELDGDRCAGNREQAEAMHEEMVAKLEARQHVERSEIRGV